MAQPAGVGSSVNRDAGAKLRPINTIRAIVGNNTTEGTGVAVDLKGYDGAVSVIDIGDSGDTLSSSVKIDPTLEESDDGSSGWTTIPASGLRHDQNDFTTIDTPTKDTKTIVTTILAGLGRKRYVRVLLTFTGTHTNGTPISAHIIKTHPRVAPASM